MDVITKLEEIYSGLINKTISSEQASSMMKEKEVYQIMNGYINKDSINPLVPLDEFDVQIMSKMVDILQFIYNDSGAEPPISDMDYDKLYELMVYAGGGEVTGYTLPSESRARNHQYPDLRGTLKKVYYLTADEKRTNPSRKYLDEWKKSRETMIRDAVGQDVDLDDAEIYIFPKWDGVSGIQECDGSGKMTLGLTRGDTVKNIAYDITRHLDVTIPYSGLDLGEDHGVKYEIMMDEDRLDKYNKKYGTDYKSTRSIVSSIINSDDVDERDKLLIPIPLRYKTKDGMEHLHPNVFNYPVIRCKLKDREVIRKFANEHRFINGLRTDGAVIYIIDEKIQKILGRTDNKNNFEVAYKFTEEVTKSKITGIEFSVKNFGRITPVAVFKPVKMKGNTVDHACMGSKARFDKLSLAIGDDISVRYDIIPYITFDTNCDRSGNPPIQFPKCCPKCQEPLVYTDDDAIVKCDNPECPSKTTGKILNFVSKMKIKNISFATVNLLKDNGYLDNIRDLYKLEKHRFELINIPSLGAISVDRIISSIESKRCVYDYEVFGAIGIESISRRMFKSIFQELSIEELIKICEEDDAESLMKIKGIKEKTAQKIIDGVYANKKTIKFLMKELEIMESNGEEESKFTVCFTKIRDPQMEEYISSIGGECVDNVNKDTSLVIVPDLTTTSGKIQKAKDNGIPIVAYPDAKEYIKSHYE